MSSQCAVIYLARAGESTASFKRFVGSYRRLASGHAHDLIVICKANSSVMDDFVNLISSVFGKLSPRILCVSDDGIDITAYAHAAELLTHNHLCFFNTHAEIVAPEWLRHLMGAGLEKNVGIVGGTGSYESLKDGWKIASKIAWLRDRGVLFNRHLYKQWSPIVGKQVFGRKRNRFDWIIPAPGAALHSRNYDPVFDEEFEIHWKGISSPYSTFPNFPNPHVRTNGFVIRRELLRRCLGTGVPKTKGEAYEFESGENSLTRQLQREGLSALVVNSDGESFEIENWKSSHTFRLDDQRKLLFHDNQTRAFAAMDRRKRQSISQMTWGLSPDVEKHLDEIEAPTVSATSRPSDLFRRPAFLAKRLFSP